MNKEDMESNLGVIARSGSLQFRDEMEKGEEQEDIDIIASSAWASIPRSWSAIKLPVISRKYGEEGGWKWQSSGADGYTIAPVKRKRRAPRSSWRSSQIRTGKTTAAS